MKKSQSWTPQVAQFITQEDQLLVRFYKQAGCFQRWKFISHKLKEKKIQKTQFQCRDRFTNHIDPTLKHGKLSKAQVTKLFTYYDEYGPRWSFFETKLPGRCQTLLKNKFYSTLRSLLRQFVKFMNRKNLKDWKISSADLSSKLLTDLYEGRKKYLRFKNFMKNCLKYFNYQVEQESTQNYFGSLPFQLLQSLYVTIYEESIKKDDVKRPEGENKHNLTDANKNEGKKQLADYNLTDLQQRKNTQRNLRQNDEQRCSQQKREEDNSNYYIVVPVGMPWSTVYAGSNYGLYFYSS